MIVVSKALALALAVAEDANFPIFGWKNLLGPADIEADSALAGYPASNLANPATHEMWKSESDDLQYLTFTIDEIEEIDAIALARPNFGTAKVTTSLDLLTSTGPDVWTPLVEPFLPANDSALILRFPRAAIPNQKLRLGMLPSAGIPPQAAVAFAGKLLVMERSFPSEITPLPHAIQTNVSQGVSDGGELLGAIQLSEISQSAISFQMLDEAWYRSQMAPFVRAANRMQPFFFAPQPQTHPEDAAYAWFPQPAIPVFKTEFDTVDISLQLRAVS